MVKKWGREKFILHAIIPALYPFWWKFYWLSLSTFIFSMLGTQSWKNKIVTKIWKLKRWWYLSKLLTITITSFNFFNCPVKLQRNLKLKFRLKFNHGFTNHGYLHIAVWKVLYNIKIKKIQRARENQFFFQNVQNNEIFDIFKMFKNDIWINVCNAKSKRL